MKPVHIKSDGTNRGTKIFFNGIQLKNIKSLRLEGDAEDDILELHLTLYALPDAVDVEVDGNLAVTAEQLAAPAVAAEVAAVAQEHARHCPFFADPQQSNSGFCARDGKTAEAHCQVCVTMRAAAEKVYSNGAKGAPR